MNGSENISYVVAFTAGTLTFLSPCILPLIPSFIAYITGVSADDWKDRDRVKSATKKTAIHSLLFILGFSIVFILLGLTATLAGKALFKYQGIIRIAGGALIFIFGLHLVGILKMDFLGKEKRLPISAKAATYAGSFLIGVTFAAAWTPCAGPILGSILVLAGTKDNLMEGAKLLSIYSLGIGVPFFITGLLVNSFMEYFNKFKKVIGAVNIAGGVFLIIVGILVMTNYLTVIGEKATRIFIK